MLKNKTIVLGVTGGIAAYKSAEIIRSCVQKGADIHVMMTRAAKEFITPLTLQTLSGHPVHSELFDLTQEQEIGHISLADRADIIVIAPATADIIAKTAHGICDDLITTVLCATQAPVLFSPAMNVHMWENPITQENVKKLQKHGYHFLEPATGDLACGYTGKGRLPDPEKILEAISKIVSSKKK
ncbi:MAG: bifunctional phosphopantothenoylcysteine decarboxylase/phosphopantothenate--cysteine ligase CoaBC [Deltaproteobacteria bacterium]|nr:MAG: bifunctional phosphopantothenoylcysteine decarboxylase/phosphopantothenate--cysteine ligase CoaBC [Deltaproteobacteria bacterium]